MAALNMALSNKSCFCDPEFLVRRAGGSPTNFDVHMVSSSHGPFLSVLFLENWGVDESSQRRGKLVFIIKSEEPAGLKHDFSWWKVALVTHSSPGCISLWSSDVDSFQVEIFRGASQDPFWRESRDRDLLSQARSFVLFLHVVGLRCYDSEQ